MSLPKKNRLSLRQNKGLFSAGQKLYSQHFTVIRSQSYEICDLTSDIQKPTFSILVSKKTAKKAHDRNKIRRLTVSAIQNLLYQFPAGQYLVIPKSSVFTTPFSDLLSDLSSLLPQLSSLRAERGNLYK